MIEWEGEMREGKEGKRRVGGKLKILKVKTHLEKGRDGL